VLLLILLASFAGAMNSAVAEKDEQIQAGE
jgi:hypothetical protein